MLQLSLTVALGRAALAFSMSQRADSRKAVSRAPVKWDGAFLCADSLQQIVCLSLLGKACWGPFAPALLPLISHKTRWHHHSPLP